MRKTVKNIEKREKCLKPAKNVVKPSKPRQKYQNIIKNVNKSRKKR